MLARGAMAPVLALTGRRFGMVPSRVLSFDNGRYRKLKWIGRGVKLACVNRALALYQHFLGEE